MSKTPGNDQIESGLIPTGLLKRLRPEEVFPSKNNPRLLFDPEPLKVLKENIRQHGVLVPITVFQLKGQSKYHILDGERRHRCCVELQAEGKEIAIPANIVEPPSRVAGMLYMFSIHNIRQPWELMPVALSLQTIIDDLGESDTDKLAQLTGLSSPQVERCKILLNFPAKYQQMSLEPDPTSRIPANFWIEAFPLFEIAEQVIPKFFKDYGKNGICDRLVEKYRAGSIKSVIHFRRVTEAFAESREERAADFSRAFSNYLQDVESETRSAFDTFVLEPRKVAGAIAACDEFLKQIRKQKLENIVERDDVRKHLLAVRSFVDKLLSKLEGSDEPKE